MSWPCFRRTNGSCSIEREATNLQQGQSTTSAAASPPWPIPLVLIGASAGGLDPITRLLDALPPDTGMAFLVVQHLEPSDVLP
jgi:chemotaxis response regulator CheB